MDRTSPEHSEKDPGTQFVLDPRLAQAQSLRDLASDWYELSVICGRIGAKIERAVKRVLYEAINNPESNDDNPN